MQHRVVGRLDAVGDPHRIENHAFATVFAFSVDIEALQLSLFDEQDLREISSPDFPGERLVCCRDPALAAQRAHKRQDMLTAREDAIAAEAALDAIYALRTSLPTERLANNDVVARYRGLEDVQRSFRALNSELDVRPIRHRLAERVRAQMFLRMLSYYISGHMKQVLAPILFQDNDKLAAAAKRANPVVAAERSDAALTPAALRHALIPDQAFDEFDDSLLSCCCVEFAAHLDKPVVVELTSSPQ